MGAETRPGTTVEEIHQILRERIVEGRYAPGHRLSQGALARELETSRTPLREALHRLEADGLVVSEANRGMEVAPTSAAEAEQHYVLRLLVEPPTISGLFGRLSEGDMVRMARELDAMEASAHRIRDFQEAHLRFHQTAIRHYPRALAQLTESLHLKIYRHQRLYLSHPHAPEDFTAVDRRFLQAFREWDSELARQILEFHLIDAAIGLVMDSDPDHVFDALLVATRGLGIELDTTPEGRMEPPVALRWRRLGARGDFALETPNLYMTGGKETSGEHGEQSRPDRTELEHHHGDRDPRHAAGPRGDTSPAVHFPLLPHADAAGDP